MVLLISLVVAAAYVTEAKCLYQEDSENVPIVLSIKTRGSFFEKGGFDGPFQLRDIRLRETPLMLRCAKGDAIEHQFNQRVSENDHGQTIRDDTTKQRCAIASTTKMESRVRPSDNSHTNKNKAWIGLDDTPRVCMRPPLTTGGTMRPSPLTQLVLRQAQGCRSQAYADSSRAELPRGGKTACSPGL
jgi:hypothetical protein